MKFRDYQFEGEAKIMAAIEARKRRLIAVMATGTGKSKLFAKIAANMLNRGRIMVLAHRDELIRSAVKHIYEATGIMPAVEKAEERVENQEGVLGYARIVVSSIQTQVANKCARMKKFHPGDFGLLIFDEFHLSAATTWKLAVEHYMQNSNCVLLGVTATADRADEQMLNGELVYEYPLHQAVSDGYLVPIVTRVIKIPGLNFSHIKKTASETGLNQRQTQEVMESERNLHGVVHATIEAAYSLPRNSLHDLLERQGKSGKLETVSSFDGDAFYAELAQLLQGHTPRPTLVFAAGVAHAHNMAEIFNRWIPNSAKAVDGKTPADERSAMFADYAAGRFTFLCNVGVATTGWDGPHVSVISQARPTTSRSLCVQCIGRGTRPAISLAHTLGDMETPAQRRAAIAASEKPNCLLLDFVGNSGKHDLMTAARAFCDPNAAALVQANEEDQELLPAVAAAQSVIKITEEADAAIAANKAQWDADEAVAKTLKDSCENRDDSELLAAVEKRRGILATARYTQRDFNPLDRVSDGRSHDDPEPTLGGFLQPGISPKMATRLRNMGVTGEGLKKIHSEKHGWAVVWAMRAERCTHGQAKRLGIDPCELNYEQARAKINALKGEEV